MKRKKPCRVNFTVGKQKKIKCLSSSPQTHDTNDLISYQRAQIRRKIVKWKNVYPNSSGSRRQRSLPKEEKHHQKGLILWKRVHNGTRLRE